MRYKFPPKPQTWFGPDDHLGGDPKFENDKRELEILIWDTGYGLLTPWQRFMVGMGWSVDIDFEINYWGPIETWGVVFNK